LFAPSRLRCIAFPLKLPACLRGARPAQDDNVAISHQKTAASKGLRATTPRNQARPTGRPAGKPLHVAHGVARAAGLCRAIRPRVRASWPSWVKQSHRRSSQLHGGAAAPGCDPSTEGSAAKATGEIEGTRSPRGARLRPKACGTLHVSKGGEQGAGQADQASRSAAAPLRCGEAGPSRAGSASSHTQPAQRRLQQHRPFRRSPSRGAGQQGCEGWMEVLHHRGGGPTARPARRCRRNRSPALTRAGRCEQQAAAFAPGETPAARQHPDAYDRQGSPRPGPDHLAHPAGDHGL